ncbi:endonuclease/exonuclease/phosphatase family protein [Nocardioides caricicola]|uniref:Endonuclease/exonuclease/phosphatase family protein n=1 Tax=Nocardioides caricicola TaxID=634770 RepID=A0ABW0N2A8_9ACTN
MVRFGRRAAPSPARNRSAWAGPPPLLILVTVVGLLAAPFLDHETATPEAELAAATSSVVGPRFLEPQLVRRQVLAPVRGGLTSTGLKPVQLKPVTVGVASMNMFRQLSSAQAAADARALTRHSGVDVVGWQEAYPFTGVLRGLRGWDTQTFSVGKRATELAVSWRSKDFRLVSARQINVARGVSPQAGRYPFPNRQVAIVTLEHRATGRLLTVLNTHLPWAIEDLDRPGHWTPTINTSRARRQLTRLAETMRQADGRWVVATGDFNFDAGADARNQAPGGPVRSMGRVAVSSYQRLGREVLPTFPENGRRIDYVWANRAAYEDGRMEFLGHWVLGGLNSDHNALVARLRLD